MPVSRLTQTIDRPVDEVFSTVADLTTFPRWNPTTVSAEKLTEGAHAQGARFLMAVRGFGKMPMELDEFEANRRVRLVPQIKTFSGGHRFTFTAEGGKTRIDNELEMNGKGMWRLMTPFMGRMSRKNLRDTARTYSESSAPR